MAQNKVEGLTPECCGEVLEVLYADTSNNIWDYAVQHFGRSFVELLGAEQEHHTSFSCRYTGACLPLPCGRLLMALCKGCQWTMALPLTGCCQRGKGLSLIMLLSTCLTVATMRAR